jgi:hypothetical protein
MSLPIPIVSAPSGNKKFFQFYNTELNFCLPEGLLLRRWQAGALYWGIAAEPCCSGLWGLMTPRAAYSFLSRAV